MRRSVVLCVFSLLGCGGAATPPAATPTDAPRPAAGSPSTPAARPEPTAWTLPDAPRDEARPSNPGPLATTAWTKAAKAKGVPAAPAKCAAYARRAPAKTGADKPADLMVALLEKDPDKRDALLAAFEARPDAKDAAPTIRAIRAELAPIECADILTDPPLGKSPNVSGAAGHATVGLSLASKLARTAEGAPSMKEAGDKEKVKKFIQGPLRSWMVEQATAIDALSAAGVELTGIARGIVAIEAGMADLRLVDRIRSAPTPASWDKELKAVYEAALDEALEPRKTRGRDAALVGLADFANAGIVSDPRIGRARALLSKLYGGRRIDALDALLLPESDLEATSTPVSQVVLSFVPTDPGQQEWFAKAGVTPPLAVKSARARLEMGKNYWRRADFVEAAHAAAKDKDKNPNAKLLLALSLALAKGPTSAKEMMAAPSPSALGLDKTDALDAVTKEGGKTAGIAAFDAAHLRSLSPPDGEAAAPYLIDVATRFRAAAALLEDPAAKKRAEERAADADAASKSAKAR